MSKPHAAAAEPSADLSRTIEAVLNDKSYGPGRYRQAAAAPRHAAPAFTADALMAELSAARQAQAAEPKPRKPRHAKPVTAAKPPRSLLDQAFAYGGLAIVLAALLALSPWGRDLLAPVVRFLY